VIGTRPPRCDATDKVTGRAVYGPDVSLPDLLHGRMLRSPHARARIRAIDTRRALEIPGVYAVVTAQDLPGAQDRTVRLGEGSVNITFDRTLTITQLEFTSRRQ
jgi:xanthine dehydrogenase molybdenum-binding subunit